MGAFVAGVAVVALAVAGLPSAADTYRVNVLTYNVCAAGNSAGTCVRDLTAQRRRTWAVRSPR
ncbi:hypothetical protein [Microbispora sp. GKU 823]|uniref:hypothetical protein n=1 Tax=Microbispora sp. GKU 823 TaxID=1652100 RepID=UPI00117C6FF4|nr:hypothetical protein [Microbispora sp. GKU 823]